MRSLIARALQLATLCGGILTAQQMFASNDNELFCDCHTNGGSYCTCDAGQSCWTCGLTGSCQCLNPGTPPPPCS